MKLNCSISIFLSDF